MDFHDFIRLAKKNQEKNNAQVRKIEQIREEKLIAKRKEAEAAEILYKKAKLDPVVSPSLNSLHENDILPINAIHRQNQKSLPASPFQVRNCDKESKSVQIAKPSEAISLSKSSEKIKRESLPLQPSKPTNEVKNTSKKSFNFQDLLDLAKKNVEQGTKKPSLLTQEAQEDFMVQAKPDIVLLPRSKSDTHTKGPLSKSLPSPKLESQPKSKNKPLEYVINSFNKHKLSQSNALISQAYNTAHKVAPHCPAKLDHPISKLETLGKCRTGEKNERTLPINSTNLTQQPSKRITSQISADIHGPAKHKIPDRNSISIESTSAHQSKLSVLSGISAQLGYALNLSNKTESNRESPTNTMEPRIAAQNSEKCTFLSTAKMAQPKSGILAKRVSSSNNSEHKNVNSGVIPQNSVPQVRSGIAAQLGGNRLNVQTAKSYLSRESNGPPLVKTEVYSDTEKRSFNMNKKARTTVDIKTSRKDDSSKPFIKSLSVGKRKEDSSCLRVVHNKPPLKQSITPRSGIAAQLCTNFTRGSFGPSMSSESDLLESEDEYSNSDSFIDDSEAVEPRDYARVIREVHKSLGFDPSRYSEVSSWDDLDTMESNYAQVEREEKRSARLGAREDREDIEREFEKKRRKMEKQA